MRRMTLALLPLLLLVLGCGASLGSAKRDFQSGDYGAARETLETLEGRAKSWSESDRATYALYRGLVHHSLGDRRRAASWLAQAKAIEDRHPHTLSADDQTRLDLALEALGPEANAPE